MREIPLKSPSKPSKGWDHFPQGNLFGSDLWSEVLVQRPIVAEGQACVGLSQLRPHLYSSVNHLQSWHAQSCSLRWNPCCSDALYSAISSQEKEFTLKWQSTKLRTWSHKIVIHSSSLMFGRTSQTRSERKYPSRRYMGQNEIGDNFFLMFCICYCSTDFFCHRSSCKYTIVYKNPLKWQNYMMEKFY